MFIDLKDSYNQSLRSRRTWSQISWLCVILWALVIAISTGCLLCLINSMLLSVLLLAINLAGLAATFYLITRN